MTNESIETRAARVWLDADGIVRVKFSQNAELMIDDVRETGTAVKKINQGKAIPILADIRAIKSVTREARAGGVSKEFDGMRPASALLIGSVLSKAIGNLYLGLNKPEHPVKLFTSEAEAIVWLKGFLQ